MIWMPLPFGSWFVFVWWKSRLRFAFSIVEYPTDLKISHWSSETQKVLFHHKILRMRLPRGSRTSRSSDSWESFPSCFSRFMMGSCFIQISPPWSANARSSCFCPTCQCSSKSPKRLSSAFTSSSMPSLLHVAT